MYEDLDRSCWYLSKLEVIRKTPMQYLSTHYVNQFERYSRGGHRKEHLEYINRIYSKRFIIIYYVYYSHMLIGNPLNARAYVGTLTTIFEFHMDAELALEIIPYCVPCDSLNQIVYFCCRFVFIFCQKNTFFNQSHQPTLIHINPCVSLHAIWSMGLVPCIWTTINYPFYF